MNYTEMFPSPYFRAADLNDSARTLTIASVEIEALGDGREKPIVYFRGERKGLVLNKTNGAAICEMYGPETSDWCGQQVELYATGVDFRGDRVAAIRVRRPGGEQRRTRRSGTAEQDAPPRRTTPPQAPPVDPDEDLPW